MDIRDRLKNLRQLKNQITWLENELLALDEKRKSIPSSKEARLYSKNAKKVSEEINKQLHSYYEQYNNLVELIAGLQGNFKIVIELRYLNGLAWPEVAETMAYSEPQVYRIHREAIEELGRINRDKDYEKR